jgi:hypothetical protein
MPRNLQVPRNFVIIGSLILLFNAIIYGPGRGPNPPVTDHEHAAALQLLRIVVYILFLAGATISNKHFFPASFLLAAGLIGRIVLEKTSSLGRGLIRELTMDSVNEAFTAALTFIFIAMIYFSTFIFPLLLCLDCFRTWRSTHRGTQGNAPGN